MCFENSYQETCHLTSRKSDIASCSQSANGT